MNINQSIKTSAAILFTVTMFACGFVGIRMGLQGGYSAGALALFRYFVASIVIFCFYIKSPRSKNVPIAIYVQAALIGVFGIGIYNYTLNTGEMVVPAGIASFIISLAPVITVIFSIPFLQEKISFTAWVGLLISLIGIFIIASAQMHNMIFDKGIFYIIIATFCGAFYVLLQKPLLKHLRGIEFVAFAIWGCTAFLLIFGHSLLHELPNASLSATMAVIFLGIFPGALAYLAWSYALQFLPASKTANVLYFVPLIATIIAWLMLDEVPNTTSLVGGFIALMGAIIFQKFYAKRKGKVHQSRRNNKA